MSKESFNKIHKLISSINTKEYQLILSYLEKYRKLSTASKVSIFTTIFLSFTDNSELNYFKLKEIIKPTNENSFERTINRLQNDILDVLIADLNNTKYNRQAIDRIDIKKLHQKFMMSKERGLETISQQYLNQYITKAKHNEFYTDLVEGLYIKLGTLSVRVKGKHFDATLKEIAHYEFCMNAERKAKILLMQWLQEVTFTKAKSDKIAFILKAIQTIKSLAKKSKSKRVLFIAQRLQMEYHQHEQHYNKSNLYCNKMLLLMKNHPYLHKNRTEGGVLMNIAYNSLWAGNTTQCEQHLASATEFFVANSFNTFILKEIVFTLAFIKGDNKTATQIALELTQHKAVQNNSFHLSKWNYWLACCYFTAKDYTKAKLILNNCHKLRSDKIGWKLSIEVLKIICLIERDLLDAASTEIDYLKHLYKHPKLKARDKSIVRILTSMKKEGFNYKAIYAQHEKEIYKLKTAKGWYKWEVQTPELFLFHSWFTSKLNNTVYQADYYSLLN